MDKSKVLCPECKIPYDLALGGPVVFLCRNPDCALYNKVGIPAHEAVNLRDYVWMGIKRDV